MVKHYNTSISEDAARILNSKQGQFLSDDVTGPVAVIPLTRYVNIVRAVNSATTIYTTPADKDFYLTGLYLSVIKDAAATGSSVTITAVIEGVTLAVVGVAGITLTAQNVTATRELSMPIKLDRNSAIAISGANWTAYRAGIMGYTVETTK